MPALQMLICHSLSPFSFHNRAAYTIGFRSWRRSRQCRQLARTGCFEQSKRKMTIFELFPWLLAFCVTVMSAAFFRRLGFSAVWVCSVGLILGTVSWLLYVIGGKRLISGLERKKFEREKSARERWIYRAFDPTKQYPAEKNLFYDCLVCGNTIPSLPRRNVSCKCRNIQIDAGSGRIEIRDHAKVRLFSY